MVVLEGSPLLSTPGNQYLPPDYLGPLPTLDSKKSPLALLAQTCSQIGADSPNSKPLLSTLDKKKPESRTSPSVNREKSEKSSQRATPSDNNNKLAFKPYESTVLSKKVDESRPSSQKSVDNGKKSPSAGSDRKSATPSEVNNNNLTESSTNSDAGKSSPESQAKSSTPSASPIIRSGLEIMQGHSKDSPLGPYKPMSSAMQGALANSLLCCPPGLEQASNPAFRPPFPGAPYAHHHSMLGYPGATPGPYLSYARVKTSTGSEALVPVCKDPYCTGCQFSLQNQQLLMGGAAAAPCPSGCTQCDHQKYNLAMAMSLGPPSSLAYPSLGRPYVCNWIAGDSYCGKRFVTSEELLQHLRTHTNTSDPATSNAATLLNHSALLQSAGLHRAGYPSAPLSPLSAARYHPYAKPGLPSSLAASPYSAFNPATLGPYYSPYSLYGQRLGSAAVHP